MLSLRKTTTGGGGIFYRLLLVGLILFCSHAFTHTPSHLIHQCHQPRRLLDRFFLSPHVVVIPKQTSSLNVFSADKVDGGRSTTRSLPIVKERNEEIVKGTTTLAMMMTLLFVVGALSSLDRVAMSVALVPMSEEMHYTDTIKGSISSLYSVGYGIGIVPSGLLLASVSPRWIMASGILIWSIGTIATPLASSVSQESFSILLAARACVGMAESVVIPTIQRLLSNWVSSDNKSLAVATVYAGLQTGTILAYSVSPYLMTQCHDDWRALFVIYGVAGIIFLMPWMYYARDSPPTTTISTMTTDMQSVKIEMKRRLDTENVLSLNALQAYTSGAPWKDFVSSKGVWAMFLAHAANNWGLYNNLSWTPTFYAEQYGLNIRESSWFLILPSIIGAIGGLGSGWIADTIIQRLQEETPPNVGTDKEEEQQQQRQQQAITRIRKAFQGIGLIGPAICLGYLSCTMPSDPHVAQTLFSVAVGLQAFNAAGYGAANQEKAGEKWTGLLYGITSLPSVIIGTFAVYLTGEILDATHQNWAIVYGLNALVYFLGGAAFVALYDSKKEFD